MELDRFLKKYGQYGQSEEMLTFLHSQIEKQKINSARAHLIITHRRSHKGDGHCSNLEEGELVCNARWRKHK